MSETPSERTLLALLSVAEETREDLIIAGTGSEPNALPSLNERVGLLLRAVHGPGNVPTAEQRLAARSRLIDAMVDDLTGASTAEGRSGPKVELAPAAVASDSAPVRSSNLLRRSERGASRILVHIMTLPMTVASAISMGHPRLVATSLIGLFAISAAWGGVWLHAARTVEATIAAWLDGERRFGIYECGSRNVSGFPLRVEIHCESPKGVVEFGPSTVAFEAKNLSVVASLDRPTEPAAQFVGPLTISESGGAFSYLVRWTAASARGDVADSPAHQRSVVVTDLEVERTGAIDAEPVIKVASMEFQLSWGAASGRPSALSLVAQFDRAIVPEGPPLIAQPFGGEMQAIVRGAGDGEAIPPIESLGDWQSAGGRLELTAARLEQDGMVVTGQGSVGLTSAGRVDGELVITTTDFPRVAQALLGDGWRERIDPLVAQSGSSSRGGFLEGITTRTLAPEENGQVPPPRGEMGDKIPLTEPADEATGTERLQTLSIRFMNGTAYFGSVRLGEIPPLFLWSR